MSLSLKKVISIWQQIEEEILDVFNAEILLIEDLEIGWSPISILRRDLYVKTPDNFKNRLNCYIKINFDGLILFYFFKNKIETYSIDDFRNELYKQKDIIISKAKKIFNFYNKIK